MDAFALTGGSARIESPDQRIISTLLGKYESKLARVHERVLMRLRACAIKVSDLRDLTYRHCVPFFATLDATGIESLSAEPTACGAILAYSIPLIHIDTQIDGHASSLRRQESLWSDIARPGAVELLTHTGYSEIATHAEPGRSGQATTLTSDIASSVIRAMQRDAGHRRSRAQLDIDRTFIDRYWTSPESRLHGSGIGRLMIGLASVVSDGQLTPERDDIARLLGQMRQLADELMDVVEDVRDGLITLPVAYGLLSPEVSGQLRSLIRALWSGSPEAAWHAESEQERELRELIFAGAGHEHILVQADELLRKGRQLAVRAFDHPDPVEALLLHRRHQIDSAIVNRLREPSPSLSVNDLLRKQAAR
jgi:hypothetical protein